MEFVKEIPAVKLSIRDWAQEDRPRERLLAQGAKALSDVELVAILIRSGTPRESALELARLILHKAENDLNKLGGFTANDLMKIKGVGDAKALSILAALELGMRRRGTGPEQRPRMATSADVYKLMHPVLGDLSHEEFWLVLLDRGMRMLGKYRVSQGGMHGTVADPKLIFREALERRASCLVLCHNHPSGQLRPSEEDIQLTRKLVSGGQFLDITVQDHVIVTNGGYYSFADNGKI